MKLRDKYGWPVVGIINRPVITFLRKLIHTNIYMTWKMRNAGAFAQKWQYEDCGVECDSPEMKK